MIHSYDMLVTLAAAAGVRADQLDTCAAIGLAESAGNDHAFNGVAPDASYGLWQINMHGKLGPARKTQYRLDHNDDLYLPDVNARVMADISRGGTDWQPWGAYKNGAYLKFLRKDVPMTVIQPRSAWQAAPRRINPGTISGAVLKLFLHHTVTPVTGDEGKDLRLVQTVAFGRRFSDISYSFLVFPNGNVYEGRGWRVVGAHTEGHNSSSYGISLVGNYETQPMTDAQVAAVQAVIAEGKRLGHIDSRATLRGHRDMKATACPGRHAYARLAEIRSAPATPTTNEEDDPMMNLIAHNTGLYAQHGVFAVHLNRPSEVTGLQAKGLLKPGKATDVNDFELGEFILLENDLGSLLNSILEAVRSSKVAPAQTVVHKLEINAKVVQ